MSLVALRPAPLRVPTRSVHMVERNVMALILTLIVVVAALNIVSGLYMLVKDKSADIAILPFATFAARVAPLLPSISSAAGASAVPGFQSGTQR